MPWKDPYVPNQPGRIQCDGCQAVSKECFFGMKDAAKVASAWFKNKKTYGKVYCPRCHYFASAPDAEATFMQHWEEVGDSADPDHAAPVDSFDWTIKGGPPPPPWVYTKEGRDTFSSRSKYKVADIAGFVYTEEKRSASSESKSKAAVIAGFTLAATDVEVKEEHGEDEKEVEDNDENLWKDLE